MRHLTRHQVGYEAINIMFVLPIAYDPSIPDSTYLERVVKLIEDVPQFSRIQPRAVATIEQGGAWGQWILLKYLYEGYDEYYKLDMHLEVIHVTYEKENKEYLGLIGHYEHEHGGLFDELIEEKVLPDWSKRIGLREMPL